jgi:RNA-directed DNA polymerase
MLARKQHSLDGKKSLIFEERFELEELLKASGNDWYHQKLRSIPIPKKDGSTRMLKIPTIADRAWQCKRKVCSRTSLRVATFHERSYGFRLLSLGLRVAQKTLFNNLRSKSNGINKRVIEQDN